jgi:hypothetical protein
MDIFQVDELSLYLGNDIKVADGVVIKVPQIGQIASYGESAYFATMQTLCATPSSMKAQLDDWKLDWMKVTDFQLFGMLCTALKPEQTSLVLGDLDLSELKPRPINESGEIVLSNKDGTIIINEVIYNILVTYLRKMHGFKKQVDKAGNSMTHKMLIKLARQDAQMAKNKPYKSVLRPLISAVKCRQKYPMEYVKNMGIYEFFDDVARLNIIVQADAALAGCYSGFCDTKKMDKTVLDWTREIVEESATKGKSIVNEGAN